MHSLAEEAVISIRVRHVETSYPHAAFTIRIMRDAIYVQNLRVVWETLPWVPHVLFFTTRACPNPVVNVAVAQSTSVRWRISHFENVIVRF